MFRSCSGLQFERFKEVWDNSFSHGQSAGQSHQPVPSGAGNSPHNTFLNAGPGWEQLPLALLRPCSWTQTWCICHLERRAEAADMPELVVACEKQWDLFVHRFNLVQRGKESKLGGKDNKTCFASPADILQNDAMLMQRRPIVEKSC